MSDAGHSRSAQNATRASSTSRRARRSARLCAAERIFSMPPTRRSPTTAIPSSGRRIVLPRRGANSRTAFGLRRGRSAIRLTIQTHSGPAVVLWALRECAPARRAAVSHSSAPESPLVPRLGRRRSTKERRWSAHPEMVIPPAYSEPSAVTGSIVAAPIWAACYLWTRLAPSPVKVS